MAEEYLDEIILKARKQRLEQTLDEDVDLERDLPEDYLQTVTIGDGMASIKIPAFMDDMPATWAERKYEYEPRPEIIKTSADGNVNFTFSLLDCSVAPSALMTALKDCKRGMRRVLPELVYYDEGEDVIHGIKICWYEFSNNAAGGKIYNFQFFAATERTLMGSLNCLYGNHEVWVKIAKLCMKTLRGKAYDGEAEQDFTGREKADGASVRSATASVDE